VLEVAVPPFPDMAQLDLGIASDERLGRVGHEDLPRLRCGAQRLDAVAERTEVPRAPVDDPTRMDRHVDWRRVLSRKPFLGLQRSANADGRTDGIGTRSKSHHDVVRGDLRLTAVLAAHDAQDDALLPSEQSRDVPLVERVEAVVGLADDGDLVQSVRADDLVGLVADARKAADVRNGCRGDDV
jgi:hypothetical protein